MNKALIATGESKQKLDQGLEPRPLWRASVKQIQYHPTLLHTTLLYEYVTAIKLCSTPLNIPFNH